MKSLLVYLLCLLPLLREGVAAALVPYSRKARKVGLLEQVNKNGNGTIECGETSRSIIRRTEVHHQWTIEDFQDQAVLQGLTSLRVQSAEFGSPDKRYRFRISLERTESRYGHRGQTLRLYSSTDDNSFSCRVRLYIVSGRNGDLQSLLNKVIHQKNAGGATPIAEVVMSSYLGHYTDNDVHFSNYVENNTLVILCHVTIFGRALTICGSTSTSVKESDTTFVASFKKLLESKSSSDLDVSASDCVIPAHKSILLARSPIMEVLIKENGNRNSLNATRFRCDTMNCVVSYIYTDKCELKSETATEVLLAAHEYQLPGLKDLAEEELLARLDEENIVSTAKLAKKVGSAALIHGVSNYITRNPHVLDMDPWKKLVMEELGPTALVLRDIILHA